MMRLIADGVPLSIRSSSIDWNEAAPLKPKDSFHQNRSMATNSILRGLVSVEV
jgi:hypothetical protein